MVKDRKIRVLIIVENLPVPFDRRVWQEANALRESGRTVYVICPVGNDYQEKYENINGIEIFRHPLPLEGNGPFGFLVEYSIALFWQFYLSFKIFFTRGFDIIHACNPPDLIFLVALPFRLFFGKKFVFDHHDINPELFIAKFGKKNFFYYLLCVLERMTFSLANISIATNKSYRDIAIERGKMAAEDVFIVRSGADLDRIKVCEPIIELKQGFKYMVGYVGVMGKQEGISYLLAAVKHIVYSVGRKDICFVLVGSGPDIQRLKEECKELGLEKYVFFKGRLPDKELFEYLSTSDICVNPDEYNDMNDKSTMNKIIEYMAFGKPIVQFNLKEGRRIADGASVYANNNDSVDFANKILELLGDSEKIDKMGKIGRMRVEEKLQWKHEKKELIRAYDYLCQ